jgi:hypothetical protein
MRNQKQILELYTTHRASVLFWIGVAIYLSIKCLFSKHPEGVTLIYYKAASYWLNSQNVYLDTCPAFVYFPQSAVLFSPLALLPFKICNIVWRVLLTTLFSSSLLMLVHITSFPKKTTYFWLSLFIFPIAEGGLVQGQMGVLVTSLLLYMLCAIYYHRWWSASILLGLAVAFKPTCLVFFGLFFAVYPQLRLKVFVIIPAVLLFPFLFQSPNYVVQQYYNYYLTTQTLVTFSNSLGWANIWTLIRTTTHIVVPQHLSDGISAIVALFILANSYFAYKKPNSDHYNFFYIYALGGIYLMLFNPRTENNNYLMVMPVFILFFYYFWYDLKERLLYIPMAICIFLIAFNHVISHILQIENTIIRPICIILLSIQLLFILYRKNSVSGGKSNINLPPEATLIPSTYSTIQS